MATQVQNGKALEWEIATEFRRLTNAVIHQDTHSMNAEFCATLISEALTDRFRKAARLAVGHVLEKEQRILSGADPAIKIYIKGDSAGASGDVRDVVIVTKSREIGVSCKTNHEAFKHPRLSKKINWVAKWGLSPIG